MGYTQRGTQEYPQELVAEMEQPGHFILLAKQL